MVSSPNMFVRLLPRGFHVCDVTFSKGQQPSRKLQIVHNCSRDLDVSPRSQTVSHTRWDLTAEGQQYAKEGTPEAQLFHALPEEGTISREALEVLILTILVWGFAFVKYILSCPPG
jgi:hypothetical protein